MRARVSRKWYLVVIVLLYIGLLASFSLNVTLLMRKPVTTITLPPDTQVRWTLHPVTGRSSVYGLFPSNIMLYLPSVYGLLPFKYNAEHGLLSVCAKCSIFVD